MDHAITHVLDGHKGAFVIERDGTRLATMTYSVAGDDMIIIDHTEVGDSLRGTGAARRWSRRPWRGRATAIAGSCPSVRLRARCSSARRSMRDVQGLTPCPRCEPSSSPAT